MGAPAAKTTVRGAAAGSSSAGAGSNMERCDKPLGTMALVEEANQPWLRTLMADYRINSTIPLLRLMIQQSNCFVIVERGSALNNMMGERALSRSGELRKKSKVGKGQMVAADYTATPSVTFSARDTGGAGAAIGGMFGKAGAVIGASLRSQEASTILLVTDNRSGIQLAAAEGSAKNWDFGAAGGLLGGIGAVGGGFSNTPEGKLIAAAFADSYNQLVRSVRQYKAQDVKGGLGRGGQLKTN